MTLLSVNILRKSFVLPGVGDPLIVLDDVTFEVGDGEFVCVLGPSGCGKTTVLQLVAGLDAEFEGQISLDGAPPGQGPRVGYMFQSPRLMPWMTVLENLRLVASKDSIASALPERLLTDFDLQAFMNAHPNRLSGGMQRRVALARAYAVEPKILLLDEPFVSLDVPVASALRILLLKQCRQRKATVLFVTHDLGEALFLADRILFMSPRPGKIVLEYQVPIKRPRSESKDLEAVREDLLRRFPQILSGLAGPDQGAVSEDLAGAVFRA